MPTLPWAHLRPDEAPAHHRTTPVVLTPEQESHLNDVSTEAAAAKSPGRRPLGAAKEAILASVVLAFAYLLLRTSPYLAAGAFNDDGVYLALGKALAEGEGYRSIYAVGEPVHAKYPPGVPVLYAALWSLWSDLATVHQAALILSLFATAGAAGLLWWLARARMGLGVGFTLFFVFGPFLLEGSVQYFNLPVSEPYYMLLWAAALVLAFRLTQPSGPAVAGEGNAPSRAGGLAAAVLLGVVVASAVLFRSQGIVLIPALAIGLLVLRVGARSQAAFLVTATLPVLAWRLWHRAALQRGPVGTQPDEGAYVSWTPSGSPGEVVRFLRDVVRSQTVHYGTFMPPHLSELWPVGLFLWASLVVLAVAGGVMLWRRHADVVLSCAASAAVVFLWPWWQDRFVLTLLPFLGLLAGSALQRWSMPLAPRPRRALYLAMGLVALLIALRQSEIRRMGLGAGEVQSVVFHPAQFLPRNTLYVLAASRWMATNTPADADVLAPHPAGIWLYTGRKVVNSTPALPDVGPSEWSVPGRFLARRAVEDQPDLLALWSLNQQIALDVSVVQKACPEALEYLGYTQEYTRVAFYRVHGEDACFRQRFLEAARSELAREAAERG